MFNLNEKINESMQIINEHAKLVLRELLHIRNGLADWCTDALTAKLTEDVELKQILLDQANELIAPQMTFENFDEAYHMMNHTCQEFTENMSDFWLELDAMTISKLLCIPTVCPHCRSTIEETDEFCPSCGQHVGASRPYEAPVTVSVQKCTCGRTHNISDKFCPSCGKEKED